MRNQSKRVSPTLNTDSKYWTHFTEQLTKFPKVSCDQKKRIKHSQVYPGLKVRYFRRCFPIHGHHGFMGQRTFNKRKNSAFPYRSVFTDPKHTPWADRALLKSAHGIVVEKGFPWES